MALNDLSRFSFGATSAITTSMALITGLDATSNPRISIVSALLVLAIADNISDSLGIHVYRESECMGANDDAKIYTISNFLTRLALSFVFIAIVLLMPLAYAIPLTVIIGLSVLGFLSYRIAIKQKKNIYKEVVLHLGIAIAVVVLSHFIGQTIATALGI